MEEMYCKECQKIVTESDVYLAHDIHMELDSQREEIRAAGNVHLHCGDCETIVASGYFANDDYFDIEINTDIDYVQFSSEVIAVSYSVGTNYGREIIPGNMEMTLEDCGMEATYTKPEAPIDPIVELETLLNDMQNMPYFSIRAKVMELSNRLKAQRDSESA